MVNQSLKSYCRKNKYVVQFNEKKDALKLGKVTLKKVIEKQIIKEGLTYLQISRGHNVNCSNLYDFFRRGKYEAMSVEGLIKLTKNIRINTK